MTKGTLRAYELAIKHGVKIAWGTDTLFSASLAVKQGKQLAKMSRWYTPAEVLTMATSTNAERTEVGSPASDCRAARPTWAARNATAMSTSASMVAG